MLQPFVYVRTILMIFFWAILNVKVRERNMLKKMFNIQEKLRWLILAILHLVLYDGIDQPMYNFLDGYVDSLYSFSLIRLR